LAKRIKIKGVIQPQRNKATQIRHLIREKGTAEIFSLTELNISSFCGLCFCDNKLHPE